MKMLFSFMVCLLTYSCDNHNKSKSKIVEVPVNNANIGDYSSFKNGITVYKKKLKNSTLQTQTNFVYALINDSIYSYWQGTPWNFNGTTQTPKQGSIACGYFVTNTLAALGFTIERTKLAQAPSSYMINKLCVNIQHFSNFQQLADYLIAQENNAIFIIRLDFHTGYILKDSSGNYFLHSNYIKKQGVIKEEITASKALLSSKSFMLGNLTANKQLLRSWANQ